MNMFVLKTQQSYLFFLLLLFLGLISVQSMRFDLPYDKAGRCFAEEVRKNTMVVGNYSIVNSNQAHPLPPHHTMTVQVSTNGGKNSIHLAERVQAGQFSFTTYENEDYLICFLDTSESDDHQVILSIDFEWKTGVSVTLGHPFIAKRSNIDRMVHEVQNLHETVLSIGEEMTYLLRRNEEMTEVNWITDNRMFLLIFVSLFVSFSVTGLQLWHLKRFFQKKKLI
ncbi:transmembrane emp24 domain-containing protein p24delta8-like [Trifolium pratense]|uniref:Uncharacterized protein n=1 Tax=Trifolium pratense TaxID=57577 RepID=A0ACB0JSG2_TRIPR|nr:transmembrane emp24 domain-containing protein p24delta8-like [Trifolium pratense]CAJ2648034.1 unnamed protein product [Trifolium pratense]